MNKHLLWLLLLVVSPLGCYPSEERNGENVRPMTKAEFLEKWSGFPNKAEVVSDHEFQADVDALLSAEAEKK